jgi:hypothetical protein
LLPARNERLAAGEHDPRERRLKNIRNCFFGVIGHFIKISKKENENESY